MFKRPYPHPHEFSDTLRPYLFHVNTVQKIYDEKPVWNDSHFSTVTILQADKPYQGPVTRLGYK